MKELLRMIHVRTSNIHGLRDCNLSIRYGESVLLVGGCLSGKDSVCSVISGRCSDYSGRLQIDEINVSAYDQERAQKLGIYWIDHRDRMVGCASVTENLYVYKKPSRSVFIQEKELRSSAALLLKELHIPCSPYDQADSLSTYTQFLLSVAKAMTCYCRLIIFEFDTNRFNHADLEHLKGMLQILRSRGVSALITCDKPYGISALADRIVVMDNGRDKKIYEKSSLADEENLLSSIEWKAALKKWSVFSKDTVRCRFSAAGGQSTLKLYGGIIGLFDESLRSGRDAIYSLLDILNINRCQLCLGEDPVILTGLRPDKLYKQQILYIREDSQEYLFNDLGCGANLIPPKYTKNLFRFIHRPAERCIETEFYELCASNPYTGPVSFFPNITKKIISIHRLLCIKPRLIILESPMYKLDVSDAPQLRNYLKQLNEIGIPILVLCKSVYDTQLLCEQLVYAKNRLIRRIVSVS